LIYVPEALGHGKRNFRAWQARLPPELIREIKIARWPIAFGVISIIVKFKRTLRNSRNDAALALLLVGAGISIWSSPFNLKMLVAPAS
jgi:hypothetical protein